MKDDHHLDPADWDAPTDDLCQAECHYLVGLRATKAVWMACLPVMKAVWMGSKDVWMGSKAVWMGSKAVWMGSKDVWMGSKDVWMGSKAVWMEKTALWKASKGKMVESRAWRDVRQTASLSLVVWAG